MSTQGSPVAVTSKVALDAEISALAPSAVGDAVICGTSNGGVLMWKPRETAPPAPTAKHASRVLTVAMARDGRILSLTRDGELSVDSMPGAPSAKPTKLDVGKAPLRVAAFSSDRTLVATGNEFGEVRIFEVAAGRLLRTITAHRTEFHDMTFRPGSHLLATASAEGDLRIWDADTGTRVWGMDPDLALFALAFSPADGTLASGGAGRRLALHDRTTWTPSDFLTLERPRMVAALAWSPDGGRLAVGDIDDASLSKGTIEIRNRGTRDLVARLDTAGAPASALAFVSADTVVGAFGRELRAWSGLR